MPADFNTAIEYALRHEDATLSGEIRKDVYDALVELWEAQKDIGDSPLGYVPRFPAAVQRLYALEKSGADIKSSK